MEDKVKDMKSAYEQLPGKAKTDACEVPDEELTDVVGGVDILERIKPPSNDRPPIEAPILNPFS